MFSLLTETKWNYLRRKQLTHAVAVMFNGRKSEIVGLESVHTYELNVNSL